MSEHYKVGYSILRRNPAQGRPVEQAGGLTVNGARRVKTIITGTDHVEKAASIHYGTTDEFTNYR